MLNMYRTHRYVPPIMDPDRLGVIRPLDVAIGFDNFEILKIDDRDFTVEINAYLIVKWKDHRVIIDFSLVIQPGPKHGLFVTCRTRSCTWSWAKTLGRSFPPQTPHLRRTGSPWNWTWSPTFGCQTRRYSGSRDSTASRCLTDCRQVNVYFPSFSWSTTVRTTACRDSG